jgi:hypothetical protein
MGDSEHLLEFHYTGLKYAPPGMYLKLFHGRDDPDEEMNNWGFDGGYIGPLQWAHTTYLHHFRVHPVESTEDFDLLFEKDLLVFNGKYYGDWSLFMHDPE